MCVCWHAVEVLVLEKVSVCRCRMHVIFVFSFIHDDPVHIAFIKMWIYMYIYIYMYTYVYACMYVCMYIYIYIYIYIYTYAHMCIISTCLSLMT
jgi:hypothetical protein